MKITITKDLLSALMFVVVGVGAIIVARSYPLGTLARMGPGYFPILLGAAIALVGVAIGARAILNADSSEAVAHWEIRPLIFILIGVLVFGFLVDSHGLVPAVAALVAISRFGGKEGNWVELAILIVVLCAVAVGLFVYGLGMPFKIGPW